MIAWFQFNETSPAAPGTAASSQSVQNANASFGAGVAGPLDDSDALDIVAELQGATGGTLDVYLQTSPDGGNNWFDLAHFPQLASAAAAIRYQAPVSLYTNSTVPVVVGKNLTPALAVNTVINGAYSNRMRIVMVAGTGTTAGAPVKITVMTQRTDPRN